jgi:tetratricopeptide (TPR) repeat protein
MLLSLLSVTSAAHAGDAKLEADAKHQFEEGTKFFNLGEFQSAIAAYKEAYRLVPDPVFLYNIAQSYRLSNDLGQAVFFYRGYLRANPKAPNRREVEGRIRELDAQITRMKVISSAPPNSAVPPSTLPESRPEAKPEPLFAPVPVPRVESKPTQPRVEPTPAPEVTPEPAPQPEPKPEVAPVTSTERQPERKPIYKKWWLWAAVGGVAVVGIGLGVGLGVGLSSSGAAPQSALGTLPVF